MSAQIGYIWSDAAFCAVYAIYQALKNNALRELGSALEAFAAMSELDVFAALRMGVKFDTNRFQKEIAQFEQPKPASESESEGAP